MPSTLSEDRSNPRRVEEALVVVRHRARQLAWRKRGIRVAIAAAALLPIAVAGVVVSRNENTTPPAAHSVSSSPSTTSPILTSPPRYRSTATPPGFQLVNEFVRNLPLNVERTSLVAMRLYKYTKASNGTLDGISLYVFGTYVGPPPASRPGQDPTGVRIQVRGKSGWLSGAVPDGQENAGTSMSLGWTENDSVDLWVTTRGSVSQSELLGFAEGLQQES